MIPGSLGLAEAHPRPRDRYVPGIDGLRAIAVMAVIGFHLAPDHLPGGFAGVDLFFVISGFVVTSSLAGRRFAGVGETLAYFYARRVVRILPALLVMVVAVSLLSAYFLRMHALRIASDGAFPALIGVANITRALTGRPYFAAGAEYDPFLHTWTLGVEEQFYLLFPFLLFGSVRWIGGSRARLGVWVAVCVLSFALCSVLAARRPLLAFYLMPTRLWELGAGVVLCLTMHRWAPIVRGLGGGVAGLVAAGCLAVLAYAFLDAPGLWRPFPDVVLPAAAGAGLAALAATRPEHPVVRPLSHPWATFVGRLSYSLYLWHWPVFVLFRWTVGLEGLGLGAAALALSVALSLASYFGVEQPVRRARWAREARRRVVLAAGGGAVVACAGAAALIFRGQPWLATATATEAYWGGGPVAGRCPYTVALRDSHGATVYELLPRCGAAVARRLFVVGDSHADMYRPLVARYVAETGTPATVRVRLGCAFLDLSIPMSGNVCYGSVHGAVEEIAARLRPGDVLLMPSLRTERLADFASGRPYSAQPENASARAAAHAEARAVLERLAATGATLVFVAPSPVFRGAPFRCMDWFNRGNPACRHGFTTPRGELVRMRAPALGAMGRLSREVPGVRVWDPFPQLCPGDPCEAVRDGRPLFVDGDHLSGIGARMLYPAFAAMMRGIPERGGSGGDEIPPKPRKGR